MTEMIPDPSNPAPGGPAPAPGAPGALPIESVPVQLIALEPTGAQAYDNTDELQIGPPTLFAVAPLTAVARRYLYLLQQETEPDTGLVVLLSIVDTRDAAATRVPPAGAWQRAIVPGTVHLLASDLELTREQIVAFMGGHEPPPTQARPPYL